MFLPDQGQRYKKTINNADCRACLQSPTHTKGRNSTKQGPHSPALLCGNCRPRCASLFRRSRKGGRFFGKKSGHSTLPSEVPLARRTHHPFAVPCFGSQEHRPWDRSSRGDIIGATSSFGQKRSHAGQKSACAPSSLRELPEFGASE